MLIAYVAQPFVCDFEHALLFTPSVLLTTLGSTNHSGMHVIHPKFCLSLLHNCLLAVTKALLGPPIHQHIMASPISPGIILRQTAVQTPATTPSGTERVFLEPLLQVQGVPAMTTTEAEVGQTCTRTCTYTHIHSPHARITHARTPTTCHISSITHTPYHLSPHHTHLSSHHAHLSPCHAHLSPCHTHLSRLCCTPHS